MKRQFSKFTKIQHYREHNKNRGNKTKIDEPKTPYHEKMDEEPEQEGMNNEVEQITE